MIPEIGHFALILALSLALLQGVLPMIGAQRNDAVMMSTARTAAFGQFFFVVTLMVMDIDPAIKRAKDFTVLLGRLLAVNAERDDDLDIVVADAAAVQLFDQDRQVDFTAGIASDVGGDDDHTFARTDNIGEPR